MSTGYQRGNGRSNGQQNKSELVMNQDESMDIAERSGFTESQVKGEVDVQIATAKRYPRNMRSFLAKAESMATIDEETASSCFYSLPARSGGSGKPIEGPSVRFAEIVAASWGNMRVQAQIVDDDGRFITAQGRCWDLENNVAAAVDVRRKITTKDGKRFSDDMINTTANAACAIAFRNAVMKIVPMAMARSVYTKAREVAIGNADTLADRRARMIEYVRKMNVGPEQVCLAVEKASIEDITVDDLGILKGLITAIKDGETTVDEAFPKPEKKSSVTATEADKAKLKEEIEQLKNTKPEQKPDAKPEPPKELAGLAAALSKCQSVSDVSDLQSEWGERPLSDQQYEMLANECEKRAAELAKGK